jgi:hypothetical protein
MWFRIRVKDYNTISHYCNTKKNQFHTNVVSYNTKLIKKGEKNDCNTKVLYHKKFSSHSIIYFVSLRHEAIRLPGHGSSQVKLHIWLLFALIPNLESELLYKMISKRFVIINIIIEHLGGRSWTRQSLSRSNKTLYKYNFKKMPP